MLGAVGEVAPLLLEALPGSRRGTPASRVGSGEPFVSFDRPPTPGYPSTLSRTYELVSALSPSQ